MFFTIKSWFRTETEKDSFYAVKCCLSLFDTIRHNQELLYDNLEDQLDTEPYKGLFFKISWGEGYHKAPNSQSSMLDSMEDASQKYLII